MSEAVRCSLPLHTRSQSSDWKIVIYIMIPLPLCPFSPLYGPSPRIIESVLVSKNVSLTKILISSLMYVVTHLIGKGNYHCPVFYVNCFLGKCWQLMPVHQVYFHANFSPSFHEYWFGQFSFPMTSCESEQEKR